MSKKSLLNTCPICKGTGTIRPPFRITRPLDNTRHTCTHCGGTGYLIRWIIPPASTTNGGQE